MSTRANLSYGRQQGRACKGTISDGWKWGWCVGLETSSLCLCLLVPIGTDVTSSNAQSAAQLLGRESETHRLPPSLRTCTE